MDDDFEPVSGPQESDDWAPVKTAPPATQAVGDVPTAFLNRIKAGQDFIKYASTHNEDGSRGLVDKLFGLTGDRYQLWPERMLRSGFTLPHDVMTGEVPMHVTDPVSGETVINPEVISRSMDMAGFQLAQTHISPIFEAGAGRIARPQITPEGKIDAATVGYLPAQADFEAAGRALDSPHAPENLRRMWSEDGIHPAEAVHDAQADAFLKHEITAKNEVIKPETIRFYHGTAYEDASGFSGKTFVTPHYDYAKNYHGNDNNVLYADFSKEEAIKRGLYDEINDYPQHGPIDDGAAVLKPLDQDAAGMDEAFGHTASLSAAVTPPEDISTSVQPAQPAGSLISAAQKAADTLFDVGRDIQMKLTPMARGSVESMATVKDYMNAMRRNAWDSSRIDTDLVDRFSAEQRERMARAMEEESLSIRLGEPESAREHQGLATLAPEERQAVLDLDAAQQLAWLRARDAGIVEGDGIPMHFPRMAIGAKGDSEIGKAPSLTQMYGIRKNSPYLKQRQYMEAQETEAALKAKYGDQAKIAWDIRAVNLATKMLEDVVSGRTLINNIEEVGKRTGDETVAVGFKPGDGWFTVDHPAFQKWRPKLEDGGAVKDSEGNIQFEQVPIYVRGDFEGPIRSALWGETGAAYRGLMSLKGKTMGLIMNSPMIHNMVEFGRAFPAMPTRIVKAYFDGNRAKNDPGIMHEAIDAGLVPIGKRFFNQDINAIMEAPDLTPGRSWTAKLLAAVPGLFDEAAGTAVKQAIDKAGDFWHNTLLWDRIADLQAGLYVNFRGDLMAKGMDQTTASRVAAHFANRYAGALPKEAMSEAATKVSNFLMFSRSFTIGNLGVMKDMLTGLPKDVLAQIERDAGFKAGSIEGAGEEGAVQQAVTSAKSMARRKAMMVVAADVALMYAGNSVLQSAFNVMLGQNDLTQEAHDYLRRARDVLNEASVHPLSLLQPMTIAERLSATNDNEPNRKDRIRIGYAKDGTAIYARNPVGKIGEEFSNWFTSPIDMMKKKEGTIARPLMQILSNDAGFGRKIYDPQAATPAAYASNIWNVVKHIAGSQLPVGQITAFSDLVKGEGDAKVNALQALGPFAGFTFSKGAPGGPAVGELYDARAHHDYAVDQAMPNIRRLIVRGREDEARSRMTELDVPVKLQNWYIKSTLNPATRLSPRAMRDFNLYSTDEQKARMNRARGIPQP